MSDIANPPKLPPQYSTPLSEAAGAAHRRMRRASGATMGDIADWLMCSVSHVSDVEHGYAEYSSDESARLLAYYNEAVR